MTNWPRVAISELCQLIVDCVNKTAPCVEHETPYKMIRTTNIKNGRIDLSTCNFVSKETFDKWTKRATVEKGDVLLTREAPMGEVGKVNFNDNVFLGQRIVQYRTNPQKLDADYLLYSFLSPDLQYQFRKHDSSGSTVSHIRVPDCLKFEIPLPPLPEQQKIAGVLSVLDAKIDLNQRINTELEALAKTVYDYWFVQFDFPDEHGRPYKTSGGAMFWSDTLKREIPVGWDAQTLASLIAKQKSGEWGEGCASESNDTQVICFRGADINALNGKGELNAPRRYIASSKAEKFLASHDLVIEISGGSPTQSTGRAALISPEVIERFNRPLVCSNFCKALTLQEPERAYEFLQHWNALYSAGVFFGWEGKTSGIKNLQFDSFASNHSVPVAPKSLSSRFYQFVRSLEKRKQNGLREIRELSALRDWLLPLLMNGQVRVKDAMSQPTTTDTENLLTEYSPA